MITLLWCHTEFKGYLLGNRTVKFCFRRTQSFTDDTQPSAETSFGFSLCHEMVQNQTKNTNTERLFFINPQLKDAIMCIISG